MKKIAILIFCALFTSCATGEFEFFYNTKIVDNTTDSKLIYSDSLLKFQFLPVPNGIYFEITNNTSEAITIDWDNSYFSEPSGNTYKALNSDFIGLSTELALKQTNTTIIPPKGRVTRFTTSNKNLSSFSLYTNNSMFYNALNGVSTYSSLSKYDKFVNAGNYWPIKQPYNGERSNESIIRDTLICGSHYFDSILNYMNANDYLGLGLKINYKNVIKSYDFKFNFVDCVVYYKYRDGNDGSYKYKQKCRIKPKS
jgi:hypothetical protein